MRVLIAAPLTVFTGLPVLSMYGLMSHMHESTLRLAVELSVNASSPHSETWYASTCPKNAWSARRLVRPSPNAGHFVVPGVCDLCAVCSVGVYVFVCVNMLEPQGWKTVAWDFLLLIRAASAHFNQTCLSPISDEHPAGWKIGGPSRRCWSESLIFKRSTCFNSSCSIS